MKVCEMRINTNHSDTEKFEQVLLKQSHQYNHSENVIQSNHSIQLIHQISMIVSLFEILCLSPNNQIKGFLLRNFEYK